MKHLKLFDNHTEYEGFVSGSTMVKPNVSHCVQENEVHYTSLYDPYNGKEYVDLGLTSGTKWAKMNVGANSETNYGLYFAWGETQGYAADQVGTTDGKKAFNWADYKFSIDGSSSNFSKYNATDGKTALDAEDDAAHVNMGGDWHMPTKVQCEELLNTTYVTNTWVTDYQGSGINGYLFTSVSNGNTLFIPAAGFYDYGEMHPGFGVGEAGCVWSSSISTYVEHAWCFGFFNNGTGVDDTNYRCFGQSVRGVVG